jgi:oxaloacetate decarboxylase gamma subunit
MRRIVSDIGMERSDVPHGGVMTIAEMLGQSGKMAVIGMGIVFSFLVVLIVTVMLTGKIIQMMSLDKAEVPAQASGRGPSAGDASQAAIVAAIGTAVTQYRKDHE